MLQIEIVLIVYIALFTIAIVQVKNKKYGNKSNDKHS